MHCRSKGTAQRYGCSPLQVSAVLLCVVTIGVVGGRNHELKSSPCRVDDFSESGYAQSLVTIVEDTHTSTCVR